MNERLSNYQYMDARPEPTILLIELPTHQAEFLIGRGDARIPTAEDLAAVDHEPKQSTQSGEKTVVTIEASKIVTLGDLNKFGL